MFGRRPSRAGVVCLILWLWSRSAKRGVERVVGRVCVGRGEEVVGRMMELLRGVESWMGRVFKRLIVGNLKL